MCERRVRRLRLRSHCRGYDRGMSLTSMLYKMARASATGRAARKGPVALGEREVRKAVYRKTSGQTAKALRKFLK